MRSNAALVIHPTPHAFAGLLHKVWKVTGSPKTLAEKWEAVYNALQQPPFDAVFGSMKPSAIKTKLEKMVKDCSSEGGRAQRESGGGTDGTEQDNDETEEERKVAADLVSQQGTVEVLTQSALVFCVLRLLSGRYPTWRPRSFLKRGALTDRWT